MPPGTIIVVTTYSSRIPAKERLGMAETCSQTNSLQGISAAKVLAKVSESGIGFCLFQSFLQTANNFKENHNF